MAIQHDLLRLVLDELAAGRLVLPTLQEVAMDICEVASQSDSNAARVAIEVARDPAIASRLLSVANSAAIRGQGGLVTNLRDAIARLGLQLTRVLVRQMALKQVFAARSIVLRKYLKQVWSQSIEVAALSGVLGNRAQLGGETAMLAGLVHLVGVLPAVKLLDHDPRLIPEEPRLRRLLTSLNPHVAGLVLKTWKFPEQLVTVPRDAFDFSRTHEGRANLADAVSAAILLTQGGANGVFADVDRRNVPAFARLGLSPEIQVIEMPEVRDSYGRNLEILGR